jgi:hypothetical protein
MKKILLGIFMSVCTVVYCRGNEEIFESFKNNRVYYFDIEDGLKTRIKIDLNGDGDRDNLSFFVDKKKESKFIEIRVEDSEVNFEKKDGAVKNFFIMDSNKKDKFIEFGVICSDEKGLKPEIRIYRYNKKKKIEKINKKPLKFIIEGVSGNGKIYFWEGMIYRTGKKNIDENDVLRYYDIDDDEIVENKIKDKEKRYENDWEMVVYKEEKNIIEKEPITEEEKIEIATREKIIVGTLNKWDKFEILKVVKGTDHVKIRMYNGKTGWIGGNHMVWEEIE